MKIKKFHKDKVVFPELKADLDHHKIFLKEAYVPFNSTWEKNYFYLKFRKPNSDNLSLDPVKKHEFLVDEKESPFKKPLYVDLTQFYFISKKYFNKQLSPKTFFDYELNDFSPYKVAELCDHLIPVFAAKPRCFVMNVAYNQTRNNLETHIAYAHPTLMKQQLETLRVIHRLPGENLLLEIKDQRNNTDNTKTVLNHLKTFINQTKADYMQSSFRWFLELKKS
ncbi:hypothetical protein J2Z62_000431 [Mycoplasmoides fastidiosum]|uniref:Uncharacterized protein n=1 Tax=Mycoplasmoides fastidiosum TaxID=92758 RepID=A0ABU0LZ84_9BACT|nr:hypothetical protein [Mycoplasmoides fastidiosum]MDQ0513993.1 hypothetical protein [Mycoplasmoides fastidiosum]UUD37593.1 hypothetical protein NPA10_03435 [Mycoplasmoides fastidiosum]